MKRIECWKCGDYQIVGREGSFIKVYKKPEKVLMRPVYVNTEVNGKRNWKRVGFWCPKCESFTPRGPETFKPNKHSA